jgi:putative solute:sodium symporter small subunit
MSAPPSSPPPAYTDLHEPAHLRLKAVLLALWAAFSFGGCFFARDLQFLVAGWPFHYWMAAQGAVLVFIAIVAVYAGVANRMERRRAEAARNA